MLASASTRRALLRAGFCALVALGGAGPAALAASGPPAGLADGGSFTVIEVIDGDTLVLDDGREVRLVGIQAPKLPLGRPGFETWPLAEEARAALEELTLGQSVRLAYGGRRVDRHGRVLAHLYLPDGLWVQGEMLAAGLARTYSFADNRALIAEMLQREAAARAARAGIWVHPWYRIRSAEELAADPEAYLDSFQLVEGVVRDAAVVRNRGYLNFGDDWKTDFTIAIDAASLRLFAAAGLSPDAYEGRRIRVRGWIESFNGPLIDVTHPEQIEVLSR